MKMKSLMLLIVAAGCGLVALLGVQQVLSGDRGDGVEKVRVLVSRTDIEIGVPLDKENVTFREVPKDGVPVNAVTKLEEYEERALTSRSFANQVICLPQLGEKGVFGATIDIPDGMRVVTVPVNATKAHSGLMKAGDRVDVLVTYKVSRPQVGTVTRSKTILEYIEVWATDSTRVGVEETAKDAAAKNGVKNVSLLVSPKQANVVMLAQGKGEIALTLRSKTDQEKNHVADLDDSSLEGLQALFDENSERQTYPKEEAKPEPEPVLEKNEPNFADFLAKGDGKAKKSDKPTWKVEIFHGREKKVEEIELPGPPAPTTSAAAPTAGRGWMSTVGKFWGAPNGSR